jgi:hypothetical protein
MFKNELLPMMIGPKLVKLTQIGINEQDIVNIAALFEKYVAGIYFLSLTNRSCTTFEIPKINRQKSLDVRCNIAVATP